MMMSPNNERHTWFACVSVYVVMRCLSVRCPTKNIAIVRDYISLPLSALFLCVCVSESAASATVYNCVSTQRREIKQSRILK
jgi:hypothetical protein